MATFAISVLLTKSDGYQLTASHVLATRDAENKDEAIGSAVTWALEAKPGFSIANTICLEVFKVPPEPTD